jgi:xanthine dehydrogenase accessory factor
MRKLSQLIILVRGGDEAGSAVAHRLFQSNFRVCITEVSQPLSICRGVAFSEAVYDTAKIVEGAVAERSLPSVENIYRLWREGRIPVVVDPEMSLRAILRPDVVVNALMLKRTTNIKMSDAPLVIGIGPGFAAGQNVHMVVETKNGISLGKVLVEGASEDEESPEALEDSYGETEIYCADDPGVFSTDLDVGQPVSTGDVVGKLGEETIVAPVSGSLRGILRSEIRVLPKTRLIEIDPLNGSVSCTRIRGPMRAIAGGVLEAIMRGCNMEEAA